ncbi:ABC transporter permease [Nitratireductor sp. L1-7-SE]|uniref:ABC transporter permease n=2 Tax=Nitratireductor rhodophyticola TaxID=2854036 RepID=A0ABS7RA40_9HYPH|nr:ABC transporter permease [Nitratireductor rhodophyticola]MBY8916343.1 ABC transporter permease [Nitratireductor rhodophyticola]MBY8921706.1 ABC transporter permease [Nitratireductor rhodophyticola]
MQENYLYTFAKRIAGFVGVLFVLSLMIFILARVVPGDPARIALGPSASQEQVDAMRTEMGLDRPLFEQYASYVTNAVQGDLGRSLISGRPVSTEIASLLPATLELVLVTVILMAVLAIPLGVITARYRNTWIDNTGRLFSIVGVTMPSFLFAILLQLFAAYFLTDWPIIGRMNHALSAPTGPTGLLLVDSLIHGRFDVFVDAFQRILFPALALAMSGIGQITRITRSAMIENQRRDHVLTLQSFGVPDRVIVFRYLLKLSSIAPLTIMGLEFASLIGNAFVVELVFSWGGFASYGLNAILQKDLNAVMGVVLLSGLFFIVANIVIDIILLMVDPRLRLKGAR